MKPKPSAPSKKAKPTASQPGKGLQRTKKGSKQIVFLLEDLEVDGHGRIVITNKVFAAYVRRLRTLENTALAADLHYTDAQCQCECNCG